LHRILFGQLCQLLVDGGERIGAVEFGLARTQQVQVGSVAG